MVGAVNEHGLTNRQEQFARFLFEGKGMSEAYRNSHNVKKTTKDNTVSWMAWELLENPKVAQRLQSLRDAAAAEINFGVKEAFEQLAEDRENAIILESASAAVSATANQMKLFGLDKRKLELSGPNGEPLTGQPLSEQEQLERLEQQIPFLIPMLKRLGYRVEKETVDAD